VPGSTATSYTIDHTAGSYVFDRNGKIRLFVRHGTAVDSLEADLKRLLG
jgi:protein SCO1/2